MSLHLTGCPNVVELRRILIGQGQMGELTTHLAVCNNCLHTAETFVDADPLFGCVQHRGNTLPSDLHDDFADQVINRVLNPATSMIAEKEWHRNGLMVSRFRVLRQLGRGGFGVVYLAEDMKLNRRVALKIPKLDLSFHPEMRERFLREARAAAGLDHPGIVTLYEAGETADECYLAYAYCPGPSLAEWIAAPHEPPTSHVAARFTVLLAEALDYTHRRGVLHRDLKPGNVLLSPKNSEVLDHTKQGDARGQQDVGNKKQGTLSSPSALVDYDPKLTDFGLAKVLAEVGLAETRESQTLGTPQYMAPEQASNRKDTIGPTTDVYALGAILYELLVGRPPFDGVTILELFDQIDRVEPTPLRFHRRDVPRDLELICLTCLQKDQAHRYASAAVLADDLHRFLEGRPIRARAAGFVERLLRWARRQPKVASLTALSAAATILLAVGGVLFGLSTSSLNNRLASLNDRLSGALHEAVDQRYAADLVSARYALDSGRADQAKNLLLTHVPTSGSLDRRCFVWNYLWNAVDRSSRIESLHPPGSARNTNYIALHPNGVTFATEGELGEILIWNLHTRSIADRITLSSPRHIKFLNYSRDGRALIVISYRSVGKPDEIELWENVGHWTFRWNCTLAQDYTQAQFSQDNTKVWVGVMPRGGSDSRVDCLTASEGKLVHSISIEKHPLVNFAVSPNNQLVLTNWFGNFHSFSLRRNAKPRLTAALGGNINCFAFSQDGKLFAMGGDDPDVLVFDTEMHCIVAILPDHKLFVSGISFHPNGEVLATADDLGGIRLWSIATGKLIDSLQVSRGTNSVVFADGGKCLIVGAGYREGMRLWYPFSLPPAKPHQLKAEVWALAFSPDGRSLLAATDDKNGIEQTLHLLNWRPGKRILLPTWSNQGHQATATGICFLSAGRMASTSLDRRLRVREVGKGTILWETEADTQRGVWCLAATADGTRLATGGFDGMVKVWDAISGACLQTLTGHGNKLVRGVAFDSVSNRLISVGEDGRFCVWNLATGNLQGAWAGDASGIHKLNCVCLAPDGKTAFAGDQRGRVYFIDVNTCEVTAEMSAHSNGVTAIALSPDGRSLATGSEDRAVKVWHVPTRKELLVFTEHKQKVNALTFSPDGKCLVSGDHSGQIHVWSGEGVDKP